MTYWAIIDDKLTLTNIPGHTPARFWQDYVFRADSFAGTSYFVVLWVAMFAVGLLCHGIWGIHDSYWGRALTIAFGPVMVGTYLFMTYANFRRWIV